MRRMDNIRSAMSSSVDGRRNAYPLQCCICCSTLLSQVSYGPLDVVSGLSRYISFLVVARPPRIPGHHMLISNIKVARDESIGGLEGLVRDRGPN
jgi:hypothetical protein